MSNVLILTSAYTGVVGASGICTRNITDELKTRGHNVWILSYDNEEKEENVYYITSNNIIDSRGTLSLIYNTLCSRIFPSTNKRVESEFKIKTLEICSSKNIDVVMCVYFPLESIKVIKEVKNYNPQITTIIYELDSVGDGIFGYSKLNVIAKKNYEIWMNENYNYADAVIVMEAHKEYWENTWGNRHNSKLKVADIPVLKDRTLKDDRKNTIRKTIMYAGLLEQRYRSPYMLLSVFNELTKSISCSLEFYSKGDCEEMISAFSKENPNIIRHGYVKSDMLDIAIEKSDILVSIGNRVSNSVPSKLISYISYGKPIVHFSSQKNDICEKYLERYPLGLVLHEYDSIKENADKFRNFFENTQELTASYSEIANSLYMNLPEYSVDLIDEIIMNEHSKNN